MDSRRLRDSSMKRAWNKRGRGREPMYTGGGFFFFFKTLFNREFTQLMGVAKKGEAGSY